MFYVYVDWTKEQIPRPFYVGKGLIHRVNVPFRRNSKHKNVAIKYGLDRRVVFESNDEKSSFDEEIRLISELHLYVGDPQHNEIACNFTVGGDGASGTIHSEQSRMNMSIAAKKRGISEEVRRKSIESRKKNGLSLATRQKLSDIGKGRHHSPETRAKMSESAKLRGISAAARIKMREKLIGRHLSDEHKEKLSKAGKGRKYSEIARQHMREAALRREAKKRIDNHSGEKTIGYDTETIPSFGSGKLNP